MSTKTWWSLSILTIAPVGGMPHTGATQLIGRLTCANGVVSELLDLPISLTTPVLLIRHSFTGNIGDSCT